MTVQINRVIGFITKSSPFNLENPVDPKVILAAADPMTPEQEYVKMTVLTAMYFNTRKDKGGKLYLHHLQRVSNALSPYGLRAMTAGLGHDLTEDYGKHIAYSELRKAGFSVEVVEDIRCVSKVPGETYEEYKAKVLSRLGSIRIKIADIKDNSDFTRLKGVEEKDLERLNNYATFYHQLVAAEKNWDIRD